MDHRRWAPIRDGLLERIVDQRLAQRPVQRPSDDLAAPGIQDHRKVQETGPRRDVGDVGNPQLVRPTGREVALHQIGRRTASRSALCSHDPAPSAHARDTGAPHQARHTLATYGDAPLAQLGVDARRPAGPSRGLVHGSDHPQQVPVSGCMGRSRPLAPPIVAAGGDIQHATHRCYPMLGPIRTHELVDPCRVLSVSCANQAAAFARISTYSDYFKENVHLFDPLDFLAELGDCLRQLYSTSHRRGCNSFVVMACTPRGSRASGRACPTFSSGRHQVGRAKMTTRPPSHPTGP